MIVISYSDFSSNMGKYLKEAELSGLKILRQKKFVKAREVTSGIIPLNIDLNKAKEEAFLIDLIITRNVKDFVNSPVHAITPDDFLKEF